MSEIEIANNTIRTNTIRRRGRFVYGILADRKALALISEKKFLLTETMEGTEIEDVLVQLQCDQMSSNFRYCVKMKSTYDGVDYEVSVDLVPYPDPDAPQPTYLISAPVTDRTRFGRIVRFELAAKSSNQNEASAIISAMVVIKHFLS